MSEMTLVEAIFFAALDRPPGARAAFLDEACGGDAGLRAQLEKMVTAQTDMGAFLDQPLLDPAAVLQQTPPRSTRPLTTAVAGAIVAGKYKLLQPIGEGGMGAVWMAEQDNPRRVVALKVIRPGLASNEALKRFAQEAQILGRLHHPGIAAIYEAGLAQDGQPFFAMEFVRGVALDQFARSRSLPPAACLELMARVCDAVQHAHEQGVVHRDLKPANVLVDEAGQPRVLDFGVARATDAELSTSTRTGQVIGTPSYMSPEQVAGDHAALDRRSDVYTLGVILYQLLAGRLPYPLEHCPLPEVARLIREQEPVRLGSLDARLRGDVETIVGKALEKEPARRYQSARELADDVRRHLRSEPIVARPAGAAERAWKWARRKPTQAGLLAVSLLLVLAVIVLPTVAALRLSREQELTRRADERRRRALVQSLRAAAPESVPFLAKELAAAPEQVLPLLREQFDDPDTRFRAAVALTLLGDDRTPYLLTAIPSTHPPAESANLARAFRASSAPGLADELHRRGSDTTDLRQKVRHAILLLDLDDERLARSLLAGANPNPRSTFLEEIQTWHGTLAAWPPLVDGADDEDFRAALCAAVGRVDPARIDPEVCRSLTAVLSRHFRDAPDPGTHAAAEWSLRQWGVTLPPLADATGERRWFVNRAGMTMMAIPPGVVSQPHGSTVLPGPYFIGDREVTLGQFRRFLGEAAERPPDWKAIPDLDLTAGHPLRGFQPAHVALFCNWLSACEGRRPCYRHDGKQPGSWVFDFTADGYRLPTDAEWHHAHQAGAATAYFFGDDARWLPLYGQVCLRGTAPCGNKLPNRWGLFDVVGNVWDATGDGPASPVPRGVPPTMVFRGGAYDSGSNDCLSWTRVEGGWDRAKVGFRVVCGSVKPTREPLPDPSDGRVALAYLVRFAGEKEVAIRLRAALHGRYSDWRAAAADYCWLVERSDPDVDLWATYAALLVRTGDEAAYRSMRRRLLDQYGTSREPLDCERVAKACLLAEGKDLDRVLRMLGTALGKDSRPWARPYAELARGMAEYRRGEHAAALDRFERCREGLSIECMALRGFFRAMAYHRLGKHDEAAKAYEQARKTWAGLVAAQAQARDGDSWKDVLRATIAEAEARRLLMGRPR